MKKSTLILILIIYIASIPIINLFGMNVKLYNEKVNVAGIECLNKTDEKCEVTENDNGKKILKVKFTEKADTSDPNELKGTMLQLEWRVAPDNATQKDVQFEYDKTNERVEFYKDKNGNETGLIFFYAKTMVDVKIKSTDGTKVYTEVLVWAY